jgi:hypothetical protein
MGIQPGQLYGVSRLRRSLIAVRWSLEEAVGHANRE